ncbi:hypothetical protein Tco_0617902 [Tanacetum coccineum]
MHVTNNKAAEPDDEDTEFEAQELEKENSTTEADENENEAENNEVGNIKSKTNQKGKNKMAEKKRKIQKVGGKKTTKDKKRLKVIEYVENQETKTIIRTIKARSSPRDIVKILTGLTHLQQQLVTEMGFESFLNGNFQIETTPTKLGCWVVENFDPDKCVIRMNDDKGDIIRHVYTPKVDLEDGVFEDVEGSKKMEAIKQFQKRTTEGICGAYVESVRTLVMNGRMFDDCTRLCHQNGIKMTKAKPKIMHMDWQTTTNHLDAGVFMMRHMECFNGRKVRFNTGLQVEGKQQIRQLNGLRRKYLVKMLMTEINEKVGQVEIEAKEYNGYNENQKRNFNEHAIGRLIKRMSKYCEDNEERLKQARSFFPKINVTKNMI